MTAIDGQPGSDDQWVRHRQDERAKAAQRQGELGDEALPAESRLDQGENDYAEYDNRNRMQQFDELKKQLLHWGAALMNALETTPIEPSIS